MVAVRPRARMAVWVEVEVSSRWVGGGLGVSDESYRDYGDYGDYGGYGV